MLEVREPRDTGHIQLESPQLALAQRYWVRGPGGRTHCHGAALLWQVDMDATGVRTTNHRPSGDAGEFKLIAMSRCARRLKANQALSN